MVKAVLLNKTSWTFPSITHDPPLSIGELASLRLREAIPVYEWAEKHFILSKAYVNPGRYIPHQWQRDVLDSIRHYNQVYFQAPVQTGKSLLGEIQAMYAIDTWSLNGMFVYANEKTVKKVFKFRIREAITSIPQLSQYWSGREDDLTISNLELRNCLWGVASAENKNDLASFPAGFVYGSEVSKYRPKDFNPIDMMRGRQQAYLERGIYKRVLESSPLDEGDIFHQEIYKSGTIIVMPHVRCPHCHDWQVLTDSQIMDMTGTKDSGALRRKKEKAVRYECIACHQEITEKQRVRILNDVVWAAQEIDQVGFKQKGELISPTGEVERDPKDYEAICYNWNRLITPAYKFYECLARFFESSRSTRKLRVYTNEDMARFWETKKGKQSGDDLKDKAVGYYQSGESIEVPEGVVVCTVGIDTQDTGFYYVIRGYGRDMETWLIKEDFIECSKKREIYKNKGEVLKLFERELLKYVPDTIRFGFIDRGGHRSDLVDFLVEKIPWLHAYIGATRINPKEPYVKESTTANHFMGQTQLLAEEVADYMEGEKWHLPVDIGDEYLKQVVAQYYIEEEDKNGQPVQRWVTEANDHYRDCENYNFAAAFFLHLDKALFSGEGIARIKKYFVMRKAKAEVREKLGAKSKVVKEKAPRSNRGPASARRSWSK